MGIYLKHAYFSDSLINFSVIPENSQRFSAFDYTSDKTHLRCLTGFWIRLCIQKGIFQRTHIIGNH